MFQYPSLEPSYEHGQVQSDYYDRFRKPSIDIINKLNAFLDICPNLFVCLNRHYLNITGTETDKNLPNDYQEAIECWLKKELPYSIENYSEKFTDDGKYYTWVIPDQKFYIKK